MKYIKICCHFVINIIFSTNYLVLSQLRRILMADKIKKGDWSAQTTGILLIVGPILTILFNSLNPVNAANPFSFTFSPDKIEGVRSALSGNESNSQLFGILLTLSILLIPLSIGGISRICQDDPGR